MCKMTRSRASPGTKLNAGEKRLGGHNNPSTFFFLRGLPTLDNSQIYSLIHLFIHFNESNFNFNFCISIAADIQSYSILGLGVQHSG